MQNKRNTIYDNPFYHIPENEVLDALRKNPDIHHRYLSLDDKWQKRFMDFCTGQKTLPLLYDAIFKKIFQPDIHPERLEELISCILQEKVRIRTVLPLENILMDGESSVVMDILVELSDGSLVLIEIQKIPYSFPAERASCYSADLLLRQYSRARKEHGQGFSYKNLKKVYTILFYEKSTSEFHKSPGTFLHHGKTVLDSGLPMNFLQEFYFIALDIFRESDYAKNKDKDDPLTGWLLFLCTDSADDAKTLCQIYPWLTDIYLEMAEYRQKPEEVLTMFSSALLEMDRNTIKYMIAEQQEQIDALNKKIEEQKTSLAEKDATIAHLQNLLTEKK